MSENDFLLGKVAVMSRREEANCFWLLEIIKWNGLYFLIVIIFLYTFEMYSIKPLENNTYI